MGNVEVNYAIIGLNISFYRYNLNLTQEQLAELSGVSKQFISKLECGRGIPSLQTLLSLCRALEVNADALLRCSADYNPDAPCTLREEHNVFTGTLDEKLFPQQPKAVCINPDDLPAFDIELPDPNEIK